MTTRPPLEHGFVTPDWRCRDCGQHWPCNTRQQHLTDEATHVSAVAVALFLASCLTHALHDQPHIAVSVLYQQFLGWYQPPAAIPRRDGQSHSTTWLRPPRSTPSDPNVGGRSSASSG